MDSLPLPLCTPRLTLRPHRLDDAASLLAYYSRPEVAVHLLEEPWTPEYAAEQSQSLTRRTGLETAARALALVIEHEGRVIGDVALWLTEEELPVAEIGWVLDPRQRARGFAAEAAGALLRAGFETYGLHRVAAQMDARNTASARLAERIGMTREAHLRQNWWSKGEWTDTVVYGALSTDALPG